MPPPTDDGDPQLWERLQELSGKAVAEAAEKSAGFTEDEEAMHKRYNKALSRRTFSKSEPFFIGFFWLVCVLFSQFALPPISIWFGFGSVRSSMAQNSMMPQV